MTAHHPHIADIYIKEGIVYCIYHAITLNLCGAQWVVSQRLALQDHKSMPVYCDVSQLHYATKEARDFMALEGTVGIKAIAFISTSPVSKAISDVFVRSNAPPVPTQLFTEPMHALTYLQHYC